MKILLILVAVFAACNAHLNGEDEYGVTTQGSQDSTWINEDLTTEEPHDHHRTSTEHHHFRTSTEHHHFRTSSEPDYDTSPRPIQSSCSNLQVYPYHVDTRPGENVSFTCRCSSDYYPSSCPEWMNIYNTQYSLKMDQKLNSCEVTLDITNLNSQAPRSLVCAHIGSDKKSRATLHFTKSEHEGKCQIDRDCQGSYTCQEGSCYCPLDRPVFLNDACYPVKKLLTPCSYSVQCQALDRNSLCLRSEVNNTKQLFCLCGPGYELGNDGQCVCEDCGFKYVYHFSKRYQSVFYALMSISIVLILIGLLRLCIVHRRSVTKGTILRHRLEDCEPQDSSPPADEEKPKEKF